MPGARAGRTVPMQAESRTRPVSNCSLVRHSGAALVRKGGEPLAVRCSGSAAPPGEVNRRSPVVLPVVLSPEKSRSRVHRRRSVAAPPCCYPARVRRMDVVLAPSRAESPPGKRLPGVSPTTRFTSVNERVTAWTTRGYRRPPSRGRHPPSRKRAARRRSDPDFEVLRQRCKYDAGVNWCRLRGGSFDYLSKGEPPWKTWNGETPCKYMLMVYLDEKRWAKMPEEMRGPGSKRRSYPPQSSESRQGVALSNSASPERP